MNFSAKTINELKKLGVKVNVKNESRLKKRKVSNNTKSTGSTQNQTVQKEVRKKIGKYKVLELTNDFKSLENSNLIKGLLFEGDTFNLIEDDFIYIDGELYRKAQIITSWTHANEGVIGWLRVSLTNAPQTPPVKKLLSGECRVLSPLQVRDCNDLEVIGTLSVGDSIDYDAFNESISQKDLLLRKVIVRDSENKELIGKKVWMPLILMKASDIKYKIKKDVELFSNLEDQEGFELFKGDTFKLTDEPIQFIYGEIYVKVKIISAKDVNLQGKTGWIEIRNTNAFTLTVKPVEDKFKKEADFSLTEENIPFKEVTLNYDIIGYTPDSEAVTLSSTTILEKGTKLRLFDKRDSYNRRYVELKVKGKDNITRTVQYTISCA